MTSPRPGRPEDVSQSVPKVLRVSAALSWRLLAVAGAVWLISWIVGYLAVVIIPVAVALLLAALLAPAVAQLVRWRVPSGVATAIVVVGGIAVVGGVLYGVISAFVGGLPDLQKQVAQSVKAITDWLEGPPLRLSEAQLTDLPNQLVKLIQDNQLTITTSALSTAATLGELLTGVLLVLFTTIFFLHDGGGIWSFLIRIIPADVRPRVDLAGRRGFASLVRYVRATAAVAVVDAVGIGVGIAIVGVPLAVPLAALVFLGAFIPIVGAVIAGTVAVLVALVAKGFVSALIVLAIVIAVMQLESHILQPLLLGRAVQLHPLAVVLVIAAGFTFGGIAGALMSVPILAVLNSGIRSLLHDQGIDPSEVDPTRPPKVEPGHGK
ncbi:AI-2E family transporter [Kutzneria kofuensis]|uniref:Putative PurR-regulated permease PerM n=1 Tax=Kutzneria kofuensis TaxID=103725 RepID=A0A7W9KI52_9PSEU|nr:AI-2E family transporter [Kutzneria kofuensis]MBB5892683.1 putative PurR-regulated permease PerM [Kutzneria kofuensis]